MERKRYFMIGILLLLLGLQFKLVHSVVLNESSTRALANLATDTQIAAQDGAPSLYVNQQQPRRRIQPPAWLGWVLLTAGGVITLHALVLPARE